MTRLQLRKMPAKLKPARPLAVRTHHVPQLPEWYPLDPRPEPDKPTPPPFTDAQRRELRRQRQLTEAVAGPFDGQNVVVVFDEQSGPPRRFVPVSSPHVWYVLDERESDRHQLIYRYDMDSPMHHRAMLAVEEAFAEVGRDYTMASREEDTDERTAPKL